MEWGLPHRMGLSLLMGLLYQLWSPPLTGISCLEIPPPTDWALFCGPWFFLESPTWLAFCGTHLLGARVTS